jgi:uncharacterized OB-fold protein
MTLHPPLPVADDVSRPFWDGLKQGKLLVQRCPSCQRFQYPPTATCETCQGTDLAYEQVSGRATVHAFTETVSGARHPYFQSISPYLVGHVRLEEQDDLILVSNFPGSTYDDLAIGARAQVEFHEIAPGVVVPQFRVTGPAAGNPA